MANVIDYYLSKNYEDTQINCFDISWNQILYSKDEVPMGEVKPVVATLTSLYDSVEFSRIITSLLGSHNLNISTNQIICNLKDRISNQKLSDRFDKCIDYSSKQYKYIKK